MHNPQREQQEKPNRRAAATEPKSSIQERWVPEKEKRDPPGGMRRLNRKQRQVVTLLGLCRYLTVEQLVQLEVAARTTKAASYRLRGLAGEATQRKVRAFKPPLLRALPFRAFNGEPLQLWTVTSHGYALAGAELGRRLKVPRIDVGAAFAEHFASLTDLFVALVRPYLRAGTSLNELPFHWDVTEDVVQPWRENGPVGERARAIHPDAVLAVPSARRRFFIEYETGSHTLVPESNQKHQATLRKLERYDAFISGLADVQARVSHYQRKYPDGWPCEVLLVVPTDGRQRNTARAASDFLRGRAGTRLVARALTLEGAAAYCATAMPPAPDAPPPGAPVPVQPALTGFYGEAEHSVLKDFVLGMTDALAHANASLQRLHQAAVPLPPARRPMLDFLQRAQGEMARQRGTAHSRG